MNSATFYRQTSTDTGNYSSESDISCDFSNEYEPSSSETDDTASSYPDSESESDEETNNDVVPPPSASAVFANWGPCTLQTPKFGFRGSTDPQVMKVKLVITEIDPGPATKLLKKKNNSLVPEKRQSESQHIAKIVKVIRLCTLNATTTKNIL